MLLGAEMTEGKETKMENCSRLVILFARKLFSSCISLSRDKITQAAGITMVILFINIQTKGVLISKIIP